MCERPSDLRLRAWLRSACLLPCRAALSLMLVRYCRTARPAGACCLVIPSVLCRHHAREFPLHLIRLKRFNRCGFYPIIHRLRVAMSCYSIPSGSSSLSLLTRSVIFLVCLFLACGRMMRCRVLRPARLVDRRFATFPASPISPSCPDGRGADGVMLSLACLFASSDLWRCPRAGVRFLSLGRVRCHDVCGELTGTARMSIIGWRRFSFLCHRFSFPRHLVFDTG